MAEGRVRCVRRRRTDHQGHRIIRCSIVQAPESVRARDLAGQINAMQVRVRGPGVGAEDRHRPAAIQALDGQRASRTADMCRVAPDIRVRNLQDRLVRDDEVQIVRDGVQLEVAAPAHGHASVLARVGHGMAEVLRVRVVVASIQRESGRFPRPDIGLDVEVRHRLERVDVPGVLQQLRAVEWHLQKPQCVSVLSPIGAERIDLPGVGGGKDAAFPNSILPPVTIGA